MEGMEGKIMRRTTLDGFVALSSVLSEVDVNGGVDVL